MPDAHEGNDPMGALTTHRGPLEGCPAPDCQDRIIEQQDDAPDTQPTATVAGQSITLHVTGYPDVPNRWGSGHIRVTGMRLDYGSSVSPDARHAFVTGLWVRDDGEATDNPIDRYYDAPNGDMSDWPDWIADLTRKHTPTVGEPTESVDYQVVGDWGVDGADSAAGARAAVTKWLRAYPKCGAHAQQRIVRDWPDGSEFYGPWTDLPEKEV